MIFSQIAGSMSSVFADKPQDGDAQPPDFAVASKRSKDFVLATPSSEIVGADIKRLHARANVPIQLQELRQLEKRDSFNVLGIRFRFWPFVPTHFCQASDMDRRIGSRHRIPRTEEGPTTPA
ncbi:hypothetical protein [Mesorhizobium amorphae]|uniref:hypothetical protein n=1 Tax=Mesorhizobium amorphae TaxID=71433 RepID=UPI001FCC590F|nr:hypothetical protein [Mesorhizobium amorphae]